MRSEALGRAVEAEVAPRPFDWPAQAFDALEQAVLALDRERKVVYSNRRIEELLGAEAGSLIGMPGSRVFPGADARWLKGALREPRDFRIGAEGRELTLKAEALPIRGEDGGLVGSVVVAETISETVFKVRRLGKEGEGTRLLRAEEFLEKIPGDEEE